MDVLDVGMDIRPAQDLHQQPGSRHCAKQGLKHIVFLMQPTRVTSNEFQQSFGALSEKAHHGPVVITQHGRDSLVVMAAAEWERLRRRDRQVGLARDLPEEWIEATRNAEVTEEFSYLDAELK